MAAPRKGSDGRFNGPQKASIIMMSIDEEVASKIFAMMSEEEIKEVSRTMANLGTIEPKTVEGVLTEFTEKMSAGRNVVGDVATTQKLLSKILGAEKVASILEDMGGPAGRNTWDKLNNVNEELLASYIKNEYPQTAALVLSKIRTAQAAKVLSILPDEFALDVIQRMITMEPVKQEVLGDVEKVLQAEFMSNISTSKQADSYEIIAEVFNNFDRNTESRFMDLLGKNSPEVASRIKELMFTFDDLIKVDGAGIQLLIRSVDKNKLPLALKGANDQIRDLFFKNMSERAAKLMREDMESKGPVRMRDVDEAQMAVVSKARELSDSGQIVIPDANAEEEQMVY